MVHHREQVLDVIGLRPSAMGKLLRVVAVPLFLICTTSPRPGSAGTDYAAIVVDADSGTVLESVGATASWYPASLTKVMTVYLAFEEIEAGRLGHCEKRYDSCTSDSEQG